MDERDLATLLGDVAQELRVAGLALTGLAHENWALADREFQVLDAMVSQHERTATLLELIKDSIGPRCATRPVALHAVVGDSGGCVQANRSRMSTSRASAIFSSVRTVGDLRQRRTAER